MFQFTRARGARRVDKHDLDRYLRFNSRAHGARDRPTNGSSNTSRRFNSRAHGARDPAPWLPLCPAMEFQFTRARGARPA